MTRVFPPGFAVVLAIAGTAAIAQAQQVPDPEFDAKVERPAYTERHPAVLFDEAHHNFHTATGRYKPFADLIASDGYAVAANSKPFSADVLKGVEILAIVNAQGAPRPADPKAAEPAFTAAECQAVRDWVRGGGALLFITDHHPWGPSGEPLAKALGVDVGKSTTLDPVNSEPGTPGLLVFSRENHLIGDHPILAGRDGSERIDRVLTYTGQSLRGPGGATPLLTLSKTAVDQPRPAVPGRSGPALGRAQGLAFALGKGRVVVLGEAGMLSAQINTRAGRPMGMNVPGTDNRQLALNIMHWLSNMKKAPAPAPAPEVAVAPATAPVRPAEPGRPLSSAEIAAESEPSIAMITGDDGSVGTGFLVRPGVILTNSHVIDDALMSGVKVRFPSAVKAQQGPFPAELLYEDARRDLAFLKVKTSLPPLRVAPSYKYRKGEDITVIGNPGAGEDELIIENAISRGVMSSKTTLEGLPFYQLGIAVNPGNSGGPVFDSTGRVIGVVTRKSMTKEGLAFAIPTEALNLAIEKVTTLPPEAIDRAKSQHRLLLVVKGLGGSGAMYSIARSMRVRTGRPSAPRGSLIGDFGAAIARLEKQTLPKLRAEADAVRGDALVAPEVRDRVGKLAENLDKLKALASSGRFSTGDGESFSTLKGRHGHLLAEVCKMIKLDVPENVRDILEDVTGEGGDSKK